MRWKSDCRHFDGSRPCGYSKECKACGDYQPWKGRFLVIKLAAKGDVLRTTPLALALKQHYPGARITWLTDPDAAPLLYHNRSVDQVLAYDPASLTQLSAQSFDLIICLDKEPRAAALASILDGRRKAGFGWDPGGYLVAMNKGSGLLYDLGLSDELKFRTNNKSYQQLIIEAVGLKYEHQPYQYAVTEEERRRAGEYLSLYDRRNPRLPLIGLNVGVGRTFPTKAWPSAYFAGLAKELRRGKIGRPILLGGPAEKQLLKEISRMVPGIPAVSCDLDIRLFAALVARLEILVSADSLAMHLGIALGRKVIALFGPTCQQEIDLYGKGEKLWYGAECSPCYRASCPDAKCMAGISPGTVFDAIKRNLIS